MTYRQKGGTFGGTFQKLLIDIPPKEQHGTDRHLCEERQALRVTLG